MIKECFDKRSVVIVVGASMLLGGCIGSDSDDSSTGETEQEVAPPPGSEGGLVLTRAAGDDAGTKSCRAKGVRVLGHNAQGDLIFDEVSGDTGEVDISSIPEDGFVGVVFGNQLDEITHVAADSIESWHEWDVLADNTQAVYCLRDDDEPRSADVAISNEGAFNSVKVTSQVNAPAILALGFGMDELQQYALDTTFPAEGESKELTLNETPRTITLDTPRPLGEVDTTLFFEDFMYDLESLTYDPKSVRTPAADGELYVKAQYGDVHSGPGVYENRLVDNTSSSISIGHMDPQDLNSVSISDDELFYEFTAEMSQFSDSDPQAQISRHHKGVRQSVVYRSSNSLDGELTLLEIPADMKNASASANTSVRLELSLYPDIDKQEIYRSLGYGSLIRMNDDRYTALHDDNVAFLDAVYMPNAVRFFNWLD